MTGLLAASVDSDSACVPLEGTPRKKMLDIVPRLRSLAPNAEIQPRFIAATSGRNYGCTNRMLRSVAGWTRRLHVCRTLYRVPIPIWVARPLSWRIHNESSDMNFKNEFQKVRT